METEEERRIRRKMRIEEMRREKRRTELIRKWGLAAACVAVLAIGFGSGKAMLQQGDSREDSEESGDVRILSLKDAEESIASGSGEGEEGAGSVDGVQSNPGEQGTEGSTADRPGEGKMKRPKSGEFAAGTGGAGSGEIIGPLLRGKGSGIRGNADFPEGTGDMPMGSLQDTDVPLAGALAGNTLLFEAHDGEETAEFDETIISEYGVLIDVEDGLILAQKAAHERMNPASMTKILTVLVAAEHLTEADLDATVPITIDITDYCFVNECSITGYERDEEVPVRDLFYGTILPSGADSSLALANYVAGSQEAFVEMMNEKVAELGLAETTHFTNCVGLYDEAHYTTAYDMAVILKAAADNAFCREILSAHTYNTTSTAQHPEGMLISNWFLRRIEDRDTHGEVLCGKTGFVDQSGSCAASLARGNNGREYLCVTANSTSSWGCIADQVALYQNFITEEGQQETEVE
jgi:D-alanyl-D-alanine carboxypeptidase (penicillin-binding protein 5/6)